MAAIVNYFVSVSILQLKFFVFYSESSAEIVAWMFAIQKMLQAS